MKKTLIILMIIGFLIMIGSAGGLQSSTLTGTEMFFVFSIGFAISFAAYFIYSKKYGEEDFDV